MSMNRKEFLMLVAEYISILIFLFRTKLQNSNPNVKIFYEGEEHAFILGPHRVAPGRLSVTRTFGDI